MEGLGFIFDLATDRADKQGPQSAQPTQLIHVTVDVVGQECDRIVVIPRSAERTAHIHSDKHDQSRLLLT